MYGQESNKMPIRFVMSISHNARALSTFLQMDDTKQNEIIRQASKRNNQRKMEAFVNQISTNK